MKGTNPSVWACALHIKSVFKCKYKSFQIPTLFKTAHSKAERQVLVDSGATKNFISEKLLKRMKIGKPPLKNPQTIWNTDSTRNKSGTIKNFTDLQIWCGNKKENMCFLIIDLGGDKIILGYPWLSAFQPKINWKEATLKEDMQPIVIKTLGLNIDDEVLHICKAWVEKAKTLVTPEEEIYVHKVDQEMSKHTSTSMEMAIKALPNEEKTWDQIVPPQYHCWKKVFSEEEAKCYPKHQPWDIVIDFIKDAPKVPANV